MREVMEVGCSFREADRVLKTLFCAVCSRTQKQSCVSMKRNETATWCECYRLDSSAQELQTQRKQERN